MADLLNPVHAKRYGGGIQRILPPVGATPPLHQPRLKHKNHPKRPLSKR